MLLTRQQFLLRCSSLVVGDKERQAGAVAVRGRGGVELGVMPLAQFSALLSEDVALRRNSGSAAPQLA